MSSVKRKILFDIELKFPILGIDTKKELSLEDTRMLYQQLQKLTQEISENLEDYKSLRTPKVKTISVPKEHEEKILTYGKSHKIFTVKDIANLLNKTGHYSSDMLKSLEAKGLLIHRKAGRTKLYSLAFVEKEKVSGIIEATVEAEKTKEIAIRESKSKLDLR